MLPQALRAVSSSASRGKIMRRTFGQGSIALSLLLGSTACRQSAQPPPSLKAVPAAAQSTTEEQQQNPIVPVRVPTYRVEVVNAYPHDGTAFTQGLVYHQGQLYESTGLERQSSLRRVELETGRVLRKVDILPQYFGEGLVLFNNKFIQLTWVHGIALQYDFNSFEQTGSFRYSGEGWGITHDGQQLIMSDGTADIRFLDPTNFQEKRRVTVTDNGRPINRLNELEYVKGEIWANVWYTDRIVRIQPATGNVVGWIDLAGLLNPADNPNGRADVLNGIAYDAERDRIFITGKLWPKLFEIRVIEQKAELKPRVIR
jgi:glutaminyl-peptide cyclotransferase